MAVNETAASVFTRARSLLNDAAIASGSVFTDAYLLEPVKEAYDWLRLELAWVNTTLFQKRVKDLAYVAEEDVLDDLVGWPTDLWLPIEIKFRKDTNEEYVSVKRVDDLQEIPAENEDDRLTQWTFRDRQIIVVPANAAGQVLVEYYGVHTQLTGAASPILIDLAVSSMANYAAFFASRSVGQGQEAMSFYGKKTTPEQQGFGACGFAEKLTAVMVQNDQFIARRGRPVHSAGTLPGYFV